MKLDSWMDDIRRHVDSLLVGFFEAKTDEASALSARATELVEEVRDLTMRGGKRLRPIVTAAAYRAVNGPGPVDATVEVGGSLELLQTYLLIHDDWMDEDDERRGGPAAHYAFAKRHGNSHLGASLGILAGDLASTFAWELFLRGTFPEGRVGEANALFVRIQKEVFAGQQLDLMSDQDVERMHDLKTGSYTTRGPAELGGLLANADARAMESLRAWSAPLGIAFQLRDDLLGTFGRAKDIGKPGDDLRHGKHNAVVGAFQKLQPRPEDQRLLDAVWGRADASHDAVLAAHGALERAKHAVEDRLSSLVATATRALQDSPFDDEAQRMLEDVTRRLTDRGS